MPSARSRARAPVEIASTPDVAPFAQPHDRALAELLLDLAERHVERLVAVVTVHRGSSWMGRRWMRAGSGEVAVVPTLRRGWDINTWL